MLAAVVDYVEGEKFREIYGVVAMEVLAEDQIEDILLPEDVNPLALEKGDGGGRPAYAVGSAGILFALAVIGYSLYFLSRRSKGNDPAPEEGNLEEGAQGEGIPEESAQKEGNPEESAQKEGNTEESAKQESNPEESAKQEGKQEESSQEVSVHDIGSVKQGEIDHCCEVNEESNVLRGKKEFLS